MSSSYNKFYDYAEQVLLGKYIWGTDVFKVMLSNAAPVATNTVVANITEISAGFGYSAGGATTVTTEGEVTGTVTVQGVQVTFTASGGAIGPFRYAVLYNFTQTSPLKPLVSWWDYGSSITLNDTDSLTIKFSNASPGTIFTSA